MDTSIPPDMTADVVAIAVGSSGELSDPLWIRHVGNWPSTSGALDANRQAVNGGFKIPEPECSTIRERSRATVSRYWYSRCYAKCSGRDSAHV